MSNPYCSQRLPGAPARPARELDPAVRPGLHLGHPLRVPRPRRQRVRGRRLPRPQEHPGEEESSLTHDDDVESLLI